MCWDVQARAQNKEEESSAIEYYFQLGPDILIGEDGHQPALRELSLLDLMSQLISEPAFDVLRTKEQLGYRCACQPALTTLPQYWPALLHSDLKRLVLTILAALWRAV